MDDLISRQALMKEFANFVRHSNNSDFAPTPTWNDAVSLVASMPTAQTECKKGFWEWVDDMDYRCSVCHKYAYGCLGEVLSGHYKYCPFCGCAMEGEEDENDN